MANLVKISEMLKSASDQQLASELNTPNATVPSYLVLSELQRRKKLRGSVMNEEPQTSVAEDMEMESSRANQMGIGGLQPQMQEPQGYAGGGEVRGYAAGDYVGDYEDDLPWEERMRIWREMTGFGRMVPTPAVKPAMAPVSTAPATAPAVAPTAPIVKPPVTTPRAGIPAAAAAKGIQPPAAATTDDWGKQLKELTGQYQGMYQKQADLMQQQADELKKSKGNDAAMAAILAGLGIAGGTSQNAITNIAEGAIPGIQQYAASERERQKELQKLALGQGALGIEQIGAQLKGTGMGAEYGLGREKLGIEREKVDVARQSMANQAAQWKQMNAADKLNLNRATEIRNYLDKMGLELSPGDRAVLEAEYRNLMKVGTMTGIPQGVKVTPIK